MNITVVGGGTAGWIFTYFLVNSEENVNVTVIESSKIGIIGAGEGSTGTLIDLLTGKYFPKKIDLEYFKEQTSATNKHGIYHQNWNGDGKGYFAPLDGTESSAAWEDFIFKHVLANYGKEKLHLASYAGLQYEVQNWIPTHAFHFDGHQVGEFFKKECIKDGVKIIDDSVKHVEVYNEEIDHIVLTDNSKITADLFVDCTGFARVLSKKQGIKWQSCSDVLPVNTAIPFTKKWKDSDNFFAMTKATALSSGWMWEIPLQTRKGCGYVFDNRFISIENAQREVEEYLGEAIDPIKIINFESGFVEKFWHKNCISFGLSSGFFEPLEATSIHSTIIQSAYFFKNFWNSDSNKLFSQENQISYNRQIQYYYKTILDFISFHYLTQRKDSSFWKYMNENRVGTEFAKQLRDKSKNTIASIFDVIGGYGSPNVSLYNWIAAGLGIITQEQAIEEIEKSLYKKTAAHQFEKIFLEEAVNKKGNIYY